MLSLFPELLFLSPFAALLIRLTLSGVFAYAAYRRLFHPNTVFKALGAADAVIAALLLVGAWTQVAAIIAALCAAVWLFKKEWNPYPKSTTMLVFIMSVSMLVMGAGPFAFDLPL